MPTSIAVAKTTSFSARVPALLLPIHLETRRVEDDLCIRFLPDQPFVDTHQEALTTEEISAGRRIVQLLGGSGWPPADGDLKTIRDDWRELARRYGTNRAAWIIRAIPLHDSEGREPALTNSDKTPHLFLLPDFFAVYVYKGTEVAYAARGRRTSGDHNLLPKKQARIVSSRAEGLFDDASRWVSDFDEAVKVGLAVRIPLSDADKAASEVVFSQIVAIGLREGDGLQAFEKLVGSHRFTDGFEFLRYGTSTNNTGDSRSGYSESEEDLLGSYYTEIESPLRRAPDLGATAAGALAHALGASASLSQLAVSPLNPGAFLDRLKGCSSTEHKAVEELTAAVWPSTGDYFFNAMLGYDSPPAREALYRHVKAYLRPSGALPLLRIGNQPYGILPVTRTKPQSDSDPTGWKSERDHPSTSRRPLPFDVEKAIFHACEAIVGEWLGQAMKVVPRVGTSDDTDAEITRIVAMAPHSIDYRIRPLVDQKFVGLIYTLLHEKFFGAQSSFGPLATPAASEAAWAGVKIAITKATQDALVAMGGDPTIASPAVLGAFSWGNGRSLESSGMSFVASDRSADAPASGFPEIYFSTLATSATPPSGGANALLYDVIRRSLGRRDQLPAAMSAEVSPAVAALAEPLARFLNVEVSASRLYELLADARAPEAQTPFEDLHTLADEINTKRSAAGGSFANTAALQGALSADQFSAPALFDAVIKSAALVFTNRVERGFRDLVDALTYRLDAWFTSLAMRRLNALRTGTKEGLHWGAYGYLENLTLPPTTVSRGTPLSGGGFVHAPSVGQATAAALLRNAFDGHRDAPSAAAFRVDLTSDRVERARVIIEGVQEGQELAVLLAAQLDADLHRAGLDALIDDFRAAFPLSAPDEPELADASAEAIAARNVCDGETLVAKYAEDQSLSGFSDLQNRITELSTADRNALNRILDALADSCDAVGDLLTFEGIYQATQGNYERSGAALDAAAGNGRPPDIRSISTPISGLNQRHRVCVLLPCALPVPAPASARAKAEPRLNAWVSALLGPLQDIKFAARVVDVDGPDPWNVYGVSVLNIAPLDFIYLSAAVPSGLGDTEIEARIRRYIGSQMTLTDTATIEIDLSTAGRNVSDAMELARAILDVFGNSTQLSPPFLGRADDQLATSFSAADLALLYQRATTARDELEAQKVSLAPGAAASAASTALDICASYGIVEGLHAGPADPTFSVRKERALEVVGQRTAAALSSLTKAHELSVAAEAKYQQLAEAMQALFGESFVVTVAFESPQPHVDPALNDCQLPAGLGDERVFLWLQQVAETHPRVRKLESLLLLSEAWGHDAPTSHLRITQFPRGAGLSWQALADNELPDPVEPAKAKRARGCESIVSFGPAAIDLACLSGFAIDEWTETIPSARVATGIAFEYDQSSSQAPQAFLLAVPGNLDSETWTYEHLVEIVRDTMELAKVRLVDLDAVPFSGIFPALMFPTSPVPPMQPVTPQPIGIAVTSASNSIESSAETADAVH